MANADSEIPTPSDEFDDLIRMIAEGGLIEALGADQAAAEHEHNELEERIHPIAEAVVLKILAGDAPPANVAQLCACSVMEFMLKTYGPEVVEGLNENILTLMTAAAVVGWMVRSHNPPIPQ